MVNEPKRPVQLSSRKAHPRDEPGRGLQQIAELMRSQRFADKFVFGEDYDINVGRHFVQGVAAWPEYSRRPLEASGTSAVRSGLKAAEPLDSGRMVRRKLRWFQRLRHRGRPETHHMTVHDRRMGRSDYRFFGKKYPLFYQRDQDGLRAADQNA